LGSALQKAFAQTPDGQYDVLSLALSRSHESGSIPLDLTKTDEVQRVFTQFRPDCEPEFWIVGNEQLCNITHIIHLSGVMHCAAERRPDAAEKVRCIVLMLFVLGRLFTEVCCDG
jgi:hypothetical protein